MLRKFILTILLTAIPFLVSAQLKVGVMNPERVMDALPEVEQVQQELQRFVEQRQQAFTDEYSVWIESVTEYEEQVEAGTLTGQQRQQREQELAEKEQELEALEQRIQRQIQNRQNELLSPVMQRVENAMQDVAQELELEYVINRQTSMGDPVVYYASERGVDITDRVIQKLTSN